MSTSELLSLKEKYSELFDCSLDMVYLLDTKGKFIDANDIALNTLGYSKEDIPNISFGDLIDKSEIPKAFNAVKEILTIGKQSNYVDYKLKTNNGESLYIETYGIPLKQNGKINGILGIANDVTKKITAEKKLRESEEKYRLLSENANDIIVVLNEKYEIEYLNEQTFKKISGYELEDVLGKSTLDFIHPDDLKNAVRALQEGVKKGEGKSELRLRLKDGSYKWFEGSGKRFTNSQGKTKGSIVLRDISKSRLIEQSLRVSEEKYRNLFESSPFMVILIDFKGKIIDFNSNMLSYLNYSRLDLIGKDFRELDFLILEHLDILKNLFRELLTKGQISPIEFKIPNEDISLDWVSLQASTVEIENEKLIQVILQDITKRKDAEENSKASMRKYRHLFEGSTNLIALINNRGDIVDVNSTIKNYMKIPTKELIGSNFRDLHFFSNEALEVLKKSFRELLSKGFTDPIEIYIAHEDIQINWISLQGSVVEIENEKLIQVIIQDISKRKEAEELYKISVRNYRQLFEKSPNTIVLINNRGDIVDINDVIEKYINIPSHDLIGKNFRDLPFFSKDVLELLKKKFIEMFTRGFAEPIEIYIDHEDVKLNWISLQASKVEFEDQPLIQVMIQDITDRKVAEIRLKESEERYRLITENANDIIMIIDQNFRCEYLNEPISMQLMGFSKKDLINKSPLRFLHPEDRDKAAKTLRSGIKTGKGSVEVRAKRKDGIYIWLDIRGKRFIDYDGHMKGLLVLKDITEKKEDEQKIKDSEEQLSTVLENSPDMILTVDRNNKIRYINHIPIGSLKKHIIGKDFYEYLIPDNREVYEKSFDKLFNTGVPETVDISDIGGVWYKTRFIPLYRGEVVDSVMLIITDTTNLKNAENNLKESEEKYRLISENANDVIVIVDKNAKIKYINKKPFKKNFGYRQEEIIGRTPKEFIHPDELQNGVFPIEKLMKKSKGLVETRLRHKKGHYIDVELSVSVFLDDYGELNQLCFLRNITRRKQAELQLKESEEKYRLISENANDLVRVVDSKFKTTYINEQSHLRLLGYNNEDLLGRSVNHIVHPDEANELDKLIRDLTKTGEGKREGRIKHKDGHYMWFDMVTKLYKDTDGKLKGLSISRDITEKKLAEQRLQESEEKYRLISENANDLINIIDDKFNYEYINEDVHKKVMGYSKEEVVGKPVIDFIHPDDIQKSIKSLRKGFLKGEGMEELRIRHKDGHWIWLQVRGRKFVDDKGNSRGLLISRDITERKLSEQKLKESEEKYRGIVENLFDGYFEVNLQGEFTFVNQRVCDFLGYSKKKLLSLKFSKIIIKSDVLRIFKSFISLYSTEYSQIIVDFGILTKEGNTLFVECVNYLKYDDKGKNIGFYGFTRDITETKEFTAKLETEVNIRTKELNQSLEQQKLYLDQILKVSQFKTKFLSMMSHELRTPLNSIIGFTDLLLERLYGQLNENQLDFLEYIKSSSEHLLEMINHILDISKIEAGQLILSLEEFDLRTILEQVKTTITPLYSKKGLRFKIIEGQNRKNIYADPIRFKEILINLLNNAIKFTIEGQITLTIKENKEYWVFEVIDTGIGIEEKDFDIIFEEFKRADSPYVKATEGSGLGLSLTKRLINLHSGNITFTSHIGEGSTFTFTISKNLGTKEEISTNYKVNSNLNS